jgi:hypothetical protein
VLESSPNQAVRLIGAFVTPWFYGHGWLAPLYYGALVVLALWLKRRLKLSWSGKKPIIFFVIGASMSYGALCAALICIPLLLFTPSGSLNPIFTTFFLASVYGCQELIRSVIYTLRNQLDKASPSLKRGLLVASPSLFGLIFFASNFGI